MILAEAEGGWWWGLERVEHLHSGGLGMPSKGKYLVSIGNCRFGIADLGRGKLIVFFCFLLSLEDLQGTWYSGKHT